MKITNGTITEETLENVEELNNVINHFKEHIEDVKEGKIVVRDGNLIVQFMYDYGSKLSSTGVKKANKYLYMIRFDGKTDRDISEDKLIQYLDKIKTQRSVA